jgi:MFS family permease
MSPVVTRPTGHVPTATVVGVAAAAGLVPLNSTMVAVALPAISDDFDVSTGSVSVLVTLYLVVMLVGQPLAGRVSDRVGSRRTVQVALVGLAGVSAAAVFAPAFWFVVAARALQAVCAAALGPATQALLTSISAPDERGRVFGIMGSVLGVGAASGPIVGGALVAAFGWEAIFAVNVPIAIAAILAARAAGADASDRPAPRAAGVGIDDRVLNPVFVAGFAAQALTTQAQYALLLLTPIVLDAQGWGSGGTGVVLSTLTIGMIVMGPVGGRLGDARGRRLPTVVGLAAATGATLVLWLAGADATAVLLASTLAVFGVGLGAATPNLTSAAIGSVPTDRTGAAAGVFSMGRYAGSIGTALLVGAVVADDASGTATVLAVSTTSMVLALIAARFLPSAPALPTTRPDEGPVR